MTVDLVIEAGSVAPAVDARLAAWAGVDFARRLWAKDWTLWSQEPQPELADRLGWLDLPSRMSDLLADLRAFRSEVANGGFTHVVVLGMGGSSLAPEVYQAVLGNGPTHPPLLVLDSTHPGAVTAIEEQIDIASTLFIVSSKSGTTIETLSFLRYFWECAAAHSATPGHQFVAITDPGSPLADLAGDKGFWKVFSAPPDVGGRYSALTVFGLVPAAAIGVDLEGLIAGVAAGAAACGPDVHVADNPALRLGAFLGESAIAGRDKATFLASPGIRPIAAWIEQLVAESTGKDGRGIVPVGGDEAAAAFGADRSIVSLQLATDTPMLWPGASAEHPAARITIDDAGDLGGVMFVLEMAVAAAGSVLGIQPFNQPDVQLAKDLARRAMAGDLDTSGVVQSNALDTDLATRINEWLSGISPPEYIGVHAYLPGTNATAAALGVIRTRLRDDRGVAVTSDFGPRFLHSTGQLHKGGPAVGRFLQIVDGTDDGLDVPETDYRFDDLVAAQSLGDYQALTARGQRVLRIDLADTGPDGLQAVLAAVTAATRAT